jgi:putative membrane protein
MNKTMLVAFATLALTACDRDTRRRDDTGKPMGEPTPAEREARDERAVGALSDEDREFIEKAPSGGMFEVESSKYVLTQTSIGSMKPIAEKMVADHTKANEELKALAKKKGWTLPTAMSDKHADKLDDIKKAKPDALAKAYHEEQLDAHEEAEELFQECAKSCKDPELVAFAARTLVTIRAHKEHIKKTEPTAARPTDGSERAALQAPR